MTDHLSKPGSTCHQVSAPKPNPPSSDARACRPVGLPRHYRAADSTVVRCCSVEGPAADYFDAVDRNFRAAQLRLTFEALWPSIRKFVKKDNGESSNFFPGCCARFTEVTACAM
jgi:hypothetical protein